MTTADDGATTRAAAGPLRPGAKALGEQQVGCVEGVVCDDATGPAVAAVRPLDRCDRSAVH
eukprot:1238425-Prymnesium_polylepis.2